MLEFFCNWCAERNSAGYAPIDAEKRFEIEIGGKKIVGFIDRVDTTPLGEHQAFDYKTGTSALTGSEIRRDIQMNLSSLAMENLYGKLPLSANLLYVRKEQRVSYDVHEDSIASSKDKTVSLIDDKLGERFPPMPDYNTCKYYDYQSICEANEIEEQ